MTPVELAAAWDRDADTAADTARHSRDAGTSAREMARSQALRGCAHQLREALGLSAGAPARAGVGGTPQAPGPVPVPAVVPAPAERLCARNGCAKTVPAYRTFCTADWLRLPAAIRDRIAKARRELRQARAQAVQALDPKAAPGDSRTWPDDLAAASLSAAQDKLGSAS